MALIKPAPMDDIDESQLEVTRAKDASAGVPSVAVSMDRAVRSMGVRRATRSLLKLNQVEGFDCHGCAWPDPDPEHRHTAEFCENGAKAVAEEADRAARRPGVLRRALAGRPRAAHRLLARPAGPPHPPDGAPRRGHPLHADRLGRRLPARSGRRCDASRARTRPSSTPPGARRTRRRSSTSCSCAPSARTTCRTARTCATSRRRVALAEVIGIGKGSVSLDDIHEAELILVVGQNPGTNHPRMLTALETAKQRGATIIAVNPLPEAGLPRFRNPQTAARPVGRGTELADLHLPIRVCGDLALFQALGSLLVAKEDAARAPAGRARCSTWSSSASTRPGSRRGPTTCAPSTGTPSTSPPAWTAPSSSRPPTCWPRRGAP